MYKSQKSLLHTENRMTLVKFIEGIRCRECSHTVGENPYEYDGFIYCEDCGTYFNEEEEIQRMAEIEKLERRLEELKRTGVVE
jgi:DNA-directed RNA polymerase subunit RPC12/RpoP